jgi:hypothetical protein
MSLSASSWWPCCVPPPPVSLRNRRTPLALALALMPWHLLGATIHSSCNQNIGDLTLDKLDSRAHLSLRIELKFEI